MSTNETEINRYPLVLEEQTDDREHDIEKAYNIAHRSAKLGKKLAKQAEKMTRKGQESAIAKEPFFEQFKRGRDKFDDPYSTQLAMNAELKQRGSNTRAEYQPGKRDEFGLKNEFDILKVTSTESTEDKSAK